MKRGHESAFHELVRVLEALPQMQDAVAVGHQGPARREGVRFAPALDFSFGASEVDAITCDEETGQFTVVSRFFGLYGTPSPLPANYTEQLLYDDPDGRLRAFFDLFNHRLISLRHRAWCKYRHSVQFDGRGTDKMSHRMRILAHLDQLGEPIQLLAFAGLLQQQPLSEASFEQVLNAALDVPITVKSCHVRWIQVPSQQRNRLGTATSTLGGLCALGGQMKSRATTFQVHVGPLSHKDFKSFLPNGRRRKALCDLIDRLNADQLDCEIAVEIEPDAIEPTWLGEASQSLGSNTWLGEDSPLLAPILGDTVSRSLHSPSNDPMVA